MAFRICKWKTRHSNMNLLSHGITSFSPSFSLSVTRNDESKAIEKVNVMDKSNKNESLDHMESLWESFFATPHKWYDYRMIKKSHKAPDFKHIETGEILWIESHKTPNWVDSKLRNLRREEFAVSQSLEQLWKSFFADPSKWFDCRKIKKSDKHPDFLHKYTNEALLLKRKQVPIWVVPMLKSLSDESFEASSTRVQLWKWKNLFTDPSKWFDNRKTRKTITQPDFIHTVTHDGLWIEDKKNPIWVKSALNNILDESFAPFSSSEILWKSLFANPSNWLDYRKTKESKNFPDFKHKENGAALWLDSTRTPAWVLPKLNELRVEAFAYFLSLEDLWRSFFFDQSKWIDYREIKKSNNLPDFVHNDTAEALWIKASETPTWVTPMLKNLQSRGFAPFPTKENGWITLFCNPSKWINYRKNKKNKTFPDFKPKENGQGLWIDTKKTPTWVLEKLNDLPDEAFASSASVEDLWISFFVDRSKWSDCTKHKKSDNHPDFVHKDTTEALWIEGVETPAWATLMLNNLQTEAFAPSTSTGKLWKALFADPSKWFDNRSTKESNKHPDFKHINNGEALWLNNNMTPAWVLPMLKDLQHEAFACSDERGASYEDKWKAFFASPSDWFDNRTSKNSPRIPDFEHKKTKQALWIKSNLTPEWVVPRLEKLGNEAFVSSVTKN